MLYLKEILKEKHMSADQLSAMTGLSKTQIWHYAAGRRNPAVESLVALADALDVSLDRLIRGKEKEPSPVAREGLEKATLSGLSSLSPEGREIALAVLSVLQSQQK